MKTFRNTGRQMANLRTKAVAAALFTALATSVPFQADAATNPKAAQYYEDALTRYEKKDIPGAIIQLKNALQIDKTMLPVQVLLGKALLANGEVAAAEVALAEALRLGVSRSELVIPLAEAYLAQGKQQQVLSETQFRPSGLPAGIQAQLLLLRASASGDLGNTNDAIKAIEEARALDPNSVGSILAEVPIRIRARQLPEARAAVERALSVYPNSAIAWYQKGAVLHLSGALKEALAAYDKAIQLDPQLNDARAARIGLRIDFGQTAEAATDIAELRRVSPRDPRAAYLKALLAERNNQPAEAQAALHEVTALIDPVPLAFIRYRPQTQMLNGLAHLGLNETSRAAPYLEGFQRSEGMSPVSKLLAQIYLGDGENGKAISLLEQYLRAQPNDAQALNLLAAAHMAEGHYQRASSLLQDALRAQDSPQMQATLGLSLIGSGRPGDAIGHLETAFRKDPGQPQSGTALVGLYLRTNQAKKAVSVAEAMQKRHPESAGINNLLGMAQAAAGNSAAARSAYEKALALDSQLTEARLNLARLDSAAKDYKSAAQRLNALLKNDDRNPEILIEQAVLAERQGQGTEAQRWLEKAANAESSKEVRALLALADLNLRLHKPAPALDAAKRAAAKRPDDINVLIPLATTYLINGNAADARNTLTSATRLAEYNAQLLTRIASLQLSAKDVSGARYSLDKALSGKADYLPAIAMMADIEIYEREFAKAEKRARQIIDKAPKQAAGYRVLGDIARAQGQSNAALDAYRRAHQVEPSSGTLLKVFDMLASQNNGKAAIQLAEQWLKAHPNDLLVRRALGNAHARAGNFAAARSTYESLLKVFPDDAGVMNNLANVLLRLKDPGATKMAEAAIARDPGNAGYIDTLGWILLQSGQTERALPMLRDARLRDPINGEIRYHLAEALYQSNRLSEAREELQAALATKENFEGRGAAEALKLKLK